MAGMSRPTMSGCIAAVLRNEISVANRDKR